MKYLLILTLGFILFPIGNVPHNAYMKYVVSPSVLEVNAMTMRGFVVMGTAFQINYKGKQYVLTNKHICTAYRGNALYINKRITRILAVSNQHDLCLLDPLLDVRGLDLGHNMPHVKPVWVIGHPRGLPTTIRKAKYLYSNFGKFRWIGNTEVKLEVLDVVVYGGNSGSPIVDYFGDVVGVLFGSYTNYHTEALIVPLKAIKEFLRTRR